MDRPYIPGDRVSVRACSDVAWRVRSTALHGESLMNSSPEVNVTVVRTELEWRYEPTDFFEASYQHAEEGFDLKVDAGTAMATLTVPADPVPADLEARVRSLIENIFLVRKFQLHKDYKLEGPRIYQHSPSGRKDVSIRLVGVASEGMVGKLDVKIEDSDGNVIFDSKAKRIDEDALLLDSLLPKLPQSPTLRALFVSYSKSIDDPDDEFTHLYEIRDALSKHFGGEQAARAALGINKTDWQRLGFLTNVEPLEQGRHRGKHPHGRRRATAEELEEARKLAREWILAFAQTI
jgi:hypothetical protein